ncbi:ATP-grasp domain-containing protein [Candidatus Uabimicrobium sp. HlEnr_7]|uniref:ATP-grasp domain-containing protein n=1 Tax=Candidatus Uabimicrobium helgolandensis TaxID=3095367 RepID=UPI0035571E9A
MINVVFLLYSWKYIERIHNYHSIPENCKDYNADIAKQQMEEIESCKHQGITYYYLLHTEKTKDIDIDYGKQEIDDYEYELFCENKQNHSLNLREKTTILRSDFFEAKKCLEYLENLGSKNIVSWQDEQKVNQWYKLVFPQFTKRKVVGALCKEISPSFLQNYARKDLVFIKTEFKEISFLTSPTLCDFEVRFILENMEEERKLIISEPLDICRDKHGIQEYRAWIVKNKVSTLSRMTEYSSDVPTSIKNFAKNFATQHADIFPCVYTVDFAMDKALGPVVVEMNPFVSCGRYADNSFHQFLSDLLNSKL